MPREVKKKVDKPKSTRSNIETKETTEDKFITLSEEQLTKLIGLVTTQTTSQPVPGSDNPKPISEPTIDKSLVLEDLAPVEALNQLQNKPPPEQPPKTRLSRDEQLKQSQAMIPLQMRSSFLPSEAVPRDILDEQRKQKQMEWRKELEKQRLGKGGSILSFW